MLALISRDGISKRFKVLGYFIFTCGWLASIAGLSRIFIVLTITSVLTFIIFSKGLKSTLKISISLVFVAVILHLFMPDSIVEGFQYRFAYSSTENISEEARITIWREYLSNIPEYFFVGAFGNYRRFGPQGIYDTHSSFLGWFVQYGVIGLLGYLYLLYGLLREIFKIKKYKTGTFKYLIAWFISYLTLIAVNQSGFQDPSIYAGFAFTILWSVSIDRQHHT